MLNKFPTIGTIDEYFLHAGPVLLNITTYLVTTLSITRCRTCDQNKHQKTKRINGNSNSLVL